MTMFMKNSMPAILLGVAISMLMSSCDRSLNGYYAAVKGTGNNTVHISLELKKDSTAIFITDYNDQKPEIVQTGRWKFKPENMVYVSIFSNRMEFIKEGSTLTLIDRSKKQLNGFALEKGKKPADTARSMVLWVAPELPHWPRCEAEGHEKCLRVRWGQEDKGNYHLLHDTIQGFQYAEGINYKLQVKRIPQLKEKDSVMYRYVLENVLLQRKPEGSTYY